MMNCCSQLHFTALEKISEVVGQGSFASPNACCLSAVAHVCSGAGAGHSSVDMTPCGVACRCVMLPKY